MPPFVRQDRRHTVRVRYPNSAMRPNMQFMTEIYAVVDVAPQGIKFACPRHSCKVGQTLAANLVFPDNRALFVEGKVIRIDADGAVIFLTHPLPAELVERPVSERRAFFRLRYPIFERPRLYIYRQEYETCEMSEYGVRLSGPGVATMPIGMPVEALLTFRDGETLMIAGKVLRIDHGEVVLVLTIPIPGQRIMKEQRYLLSRYKQ